LGTIWFVILFFAEEIDRLPILSPFPEGSAVHIWLENWSPPFLVAIALGGLALLLFRRRPSWLLIPPSTQVSQIVVRLLIFSCATAFILTVAVALLWILFITPGESSENPQAGLSVVVAAIFYPLILTPLLTVLVTWLSLKANFREKRA
jgi:hypothetical protein